MVSPLINIVIRVIGVIASVITIGTFISTIEVQAERPSNYPTVNSVDYNNTSLYKYPEESIKEDYDKKRKSAKKIITDY